MNEALIERWNSRVTTEDTVYFLGDFAMGPGVDTKFVLNVLDRLNGNIIMIRGNHDMPSKYGPGLMHMLEDAVLISHAHVVVLENEIFKLKYEGRDFVMGHFPMDNWEGKMNGAVHLHGHTHNEYGKTVVEPLYSWDIGVDMYGGPVQITGDLRYLNDPRGWA
jgi:calcineurin-like phosphoesterase family protein